MDRRNGGDPLAPPRPPKLLPRVHRPRAPEPAMMSESSLAAATAAAVTTTPATATPQCTNNNNNTSNNNNSSNDIVSSSSSSNQNQQHLHSINSATNLRGSSHSTNNSNNNNIAQAVAQQHHLLTTPLLRLHQHHHHQSHQQHQPTTATTTNLSRNNSNLSQTSASSSSTNFTSSNSFARRRPPPPTPASPLATRTNIITATATTTGIGVPLLTLVNGNILSGSFLHSQEPVPVSPVTLAAPRPESERLTNEYVDTPFRTAQQLQHASRTQHPAGQNIQGQTTTQHNLLLQQSQSRQQQQQQHQQQQNHQQHSSRVGTAGSATTATATTTTLDGGRSGCDRVDAFLHSNSHKTPAASTARATGTATLATSGKQPTASSALQAPPPPARPHALNTLPITQPIITKQPAANNTSNSSSSTFTKDPHHQHPAFNDDILDLHHIGGISTPPGGISHSNSIANGAPIIIGASDVAALNPITCPRCERCRCEQCQSPRQLPQTWVCNKTCLCSAETIIDYASCLCCVKALFYHCAKDHEMDCDDGATTLCVDDPCSCLPHKRAQRWGWLGALSLVLPCLWCYWPMRGCAAICEKCYGRYAGQGCRCQQIGSTSSMLPIVPLSINGSGGIGSNNAQNGGISMGATKSAGGGGGAGHHHHHQRHHSECSAASRILRKCDLTPEKRLLDSSPEY